MAALAKRAAGSFEKPSDAAADSGTCPPAMKDTKELEMTPYHGAAMVPQMVMMPAPQHMQQPAPMPQFSQPEMGVA